MASGPDETIEDDPFARIAALLQNEAPHRHLHPARRGRPRFSNVAPIVPPLLTDIEPGRVPTLASPVQSRRSPNALPLLPSVIVLDEGLAEQRPHHQLAMLDAPTARRRRTVTIPLRRLDTSIVLLLLAISIVVFGLGIASLVLSRPA